MKIITIQHNLNENNNINGMFCKPLNTDLNHAVRKSLKEGEREISSKKALKILRRIELQSKVQSFFSKPIVAVGLTLTVAIAGYVASALAASSLALTVLGISMAFTGTMALSLTIRYACDGTLNRMSEAYSIRAHRAHDYIEQIKTAQRNGNDVAIRV